MAMSTASMLGAIGVATLSIVSMVQHLQLAALGEHLEGIPKIVVTDIDRLGVLHALSPMGTAEERQQQLAVVLDDLAVAGYLVIDQKAALTAPLEAVVPPEEILDAAGITVPTPGQFPSLPPEIPEPSGEMPEMSMPGEEG